MSKIIFSSENTCDLGEKFKIENDLRIINLHYQIGDKEYDGEEGIDLKFFYDSMRKGEITKTSQCNEFEAKEHLNKLVKEGDVIHFCIASSLSGTYSNFKKASDEINLEQGNRVHVVDTLNGSLGQGLLLELTKQYADQGHSFEECVEFAENHKQKIQSYFILEDLKYLVRGGRISKLKGTIGSIIGIKPIIFANKECKLTDINKLMSKKKGLVRLAEYVKSNYSGESDIIYIGHSDALEDANFLKNKIKDLVGIEARIGYIGNVMGGHCGPGTVAVFFTSEDRNIKYGM